MAWWNFFVEKRQKLPDAIEQKRYSLPELLILGTRGKATFQQWDTQAAIKDGLKASAIFFACVRVRSQALAQVPWKAYKNTRDGLKEIPEHPLQKLIDNPNPDFSWSEIMELMSQHIDLAGNAYLSEIRAGNDKLPVELWPLLPYNVKIQPGAVRLIESYQYKAGNVWRPIPADDMIQIKTVNPDDFLFGLPTIQAAGRAVDVDREAGQWQKSSLQNRGVNDFAIMLDPDTSQEQFDRLKEIYKEEYSGPKNARKPFFTTKDIKTLDKTAVEMDFVNSRARTWQEICAAMGVPPPMAGILEDATLANIQTCRRIFWLDTMIPLLRMIKGQLNSQLAAEFGPDIVLDYDISGVEALREDFGAKLDQAAKLWSMGVPLTIVNERLELGIKDVEKIPGASVGYLSSTLLPTTFEPGDDGEMPPTGSAANDEKHAKNELLRLLAYGGSK